MSLDPAAVERLHDEVLAPRIAGLEARRVGLRRTILVSAALVLSPILLIWATGALQPWLPRNATLLIRALGVALVLVALAAVVRRNLLPGLAAYANYRGQFKEQVVAEIFKAVCPTATYEPDQGLAERVFYGSRLFAAGGGYRSHDRVRGTIGTTPFEAAQVQRQFSAHGEQADTSVVFLGLFLHIDFNRRLRATTVLDPAGMAGWRAGDRRGLRPVLLDHPHFARTFAAYTDDETEARDVLAPLADRLLSLAGTLGRPLSVAFHGNRMYVGVHEDRALFEPGIARATTRQDVLRMAHLFGIAGRIVHDLDLGTRALDKDVDDSLLHAADAAPHPLDALSAPARAGQLTGARILDVALEAAGATTMNRERAPRPDGSAIVVDRLPGAVSVRAPVLAVVPRADRRQRRGRAAGPAGARLSLDSWVRHRGPRLARVAGRRSTRVAVGRPGGGRCAAGLGPGRGRCRAVGRLDLDAPRPPRHGRRRRDSRAPRPAAVAAPLPAAPV
ncbi:MAG: DUF3137 domain-containing protein [Vicinamibacterales bacterium]